MPKITTRWHVAAIVMAVLGFLSIVELLVVPQYQFYPGACGPDLRWCVQYEVGPTLLSAAINGLFWSGVVYVVFLVVSGIRAIVRKGRSR